MMKRILGAFCVVAFAVLSEAQGTINFVNLQPGVGLNAPVYEADGVTKCSGPQFTAELLVGTAANNLASVATTGFLTGTSAGYYDAGTQTINSISIGNPAWVQVRVWNIGSGSSFIQAQASGLPNSWWASAAFTVTLGGGIVNPSPPAALTGLGNSPVYLNSVPEPSILGLLGLGAAAALSMNRRRQK